MTPPDEVAHGIVEHGHHRQFAHLYESFLDAAYRVHGVAGGRSGREALRDSIEGELQARGARRILDCGAGTGFPLLDIAATSPGRFEISCTDGDPDMIRLLARRARGLAVDPGDLVPRRWPSIATPRGAAAMVIDWAKLNLLEGQYDYVLCRGNSLAYADTWSGRKRVANEDLIETYLRRMADRVRPGGHLHLDAPWRLELPDTSYRSVEIGTGSIREQVTVGDGRREWRVAFTCGQSGRTLAFTRYSSLLTIDRVEAILKSLDFEETEPRQLEGERPVFGTIIARKRRRPRSGRSATRRADKVPIAEEDREVAATMVHLGTHSQFAELYETYLDAVYGFDRTGLARSIAAAVRNRRAERVLDCAAGTGFPILDIAAHAPDEFDLSCTDGDETMITVLARRAAALEIDLAQLAPRRRPGSIPRRGTAALVVDWSDLDQLDDRFDYVLCRGNSLAYADTWTGRNPPASETMLRTHLRAIGEKVWPGGHLHLDAPWQLELESQTHSRSLGPFTVWEQVRFKGDHREWSVSFSRHDTGETVSFTRASSLLTIDRLQVALQSLGFEQTKPFQLPGERPSLGTIIARKPD